MPAMTVQIPADEALREQSYLVARGVRVLALAGHCLDVDELGLLRIATNLERNAEPQAIPFVVAHGDGVASFGYASAGWAIDLYEWAVKSPDVPQEQMHRITGLLLGYDAASISRHEAEASGRRFAIA
jgi:hypothetical protein